VYGRRRLTQVKSVSLLYMNVPPKELGLDSVSCKAVHVLILYTNGLVKGVYVRQLILIYVLFLVMYDQMF